MSEVDIVSTNPYPQLILSLSDQYPSITVTNTPNIILGSGGGAQGQQGLPGTTGATGAPGTTGFGYTGAYISGFTLYMTPVVGGVEQSPVAIGTVSLEGPGETVWNDHTGINVSVGGLNIGEDLFGKNAIQILKEMLYAYESVSFTSFTVDLLGGTSDRELGQTINGATRTASWTPAGPTYNWIAGSLNIVRTVNGGSPTTMFSSGNYDDYTTSITHTSYSYSSPTNLVFTLSGQQEEGSNPNITETYSWKYKMYWGCYEGENLNDLLNFNNFSSAFITSVSTTTRTFTNTSGSAKYFYFMVPDIFTEYTRFVSIVGTTESEMAFQIPSVLVVQNPYGQFISYKYYRSDVNSAISSINISPRL